MRELTDGKGVDVILETSGGAITNQALDALADFGRMIFIGQSSGQSASIDPWRLTVPNHTVTGLYIGAFAALPGFVSDTLTELIGLVLSGQLIIQIGTTRPLSQAAEAHKMLEGRQNVGKLILKP